MEVLLFNLSLNLLSGELPSEPSYLTEHYFLALGLTAIVGSCSGTRFHSVQACYFSLSLQVVAFSADFSFFVVLAGFTVNECRPKTASVTPWTQSYILIPFPDGPSQAKSTSWRWIPG